MHQCRAAWEGWTTSATFHEDSERAAAGNRRRPNLISDGQLIAVDTVFGHQQPPRHRTLIVAPQRQPLLRASAVEVVCMRKALAYRSMGRCNLALLSIALRKFAALMRRPFSCDLNVGLVLSTVIPQHDGEARQLFAATNRNFCNPAAVVFAVEFDRE